MSRPIVEIFTSQTLSAAHSGCDVIATGGLITITLPPSIAECDIRVINGEEAVVGSKGKHLVGFPPDVNPILYPEQAVMVNGDGVKWFPEEKPGRYKIPNGTILYINNGTQYPMGNDANDGLTPSTALLHMAAAGPRIMADYDCGNCTPIIAAMAGSNYFNDMLAVSGQPDGNNLVQLSLYGTGVVQWNCQGPCITIGDNGELNMAWQALTTSCTIVMCGNQANAPSSGSIYHHNNGLSDMSGGAALTIIGAGSNCSAVFFDGPSAGAASSDGFNIQNTFGSVWQMDEGGGRFTLSGDIKPTAPTIAARLFEILGTNELILGGPTLSPASAYLSIGPSLVGGNAILVTNGVAIPGGTTTVEGGKVTPSKTT